LARWLIAEFEKQKSRPQSRIIKNPRAAAGTARGLGQLHRGAASRRSLGGNPTRICRGRFFLDPAEFAASGSFAGARRLYVGGLRRAKAGDCVLSSFPTQIQVNGKNKTYALPSSAQVPAAIYMNTGLFKAKKYSY